MLIKNLPITIDTDDIAEFCKKWQIESLALFGSVLRDDFSSESDVDVLVKFLPEARIGWEFIQIQDELSDILGREVDLETYLSLSRYFRDEVVDSAQVIYEQAR
jgi:uncharacterized protein